jgi:hypothetical protein
MTCRKTAIRTLVYAQKIRSEGSALQGALNEAARILPKEEATATAPPP